MKLDGRDEKCEFEKLTFPFINLKDNTLDENLAPACPLDNGHVFENPRNDLGLLDRLPLELLHIVLAQLDISTLTDLRRLNRRALQVVDKIPQYQVIVTHAQNVLQAILSIETGRWITCQVLYDAFCTADCETCGDHAGYLYLLTCRRVCFICFTKNDSYLPLSYPLAGLKFGITRQVIDILPHMKSIPGTFSPNGRKCKNRLRLVDHDSARCAGIKIHGTAITMEQYVADVARRKQEEFEKKLGKRFEKRKTHVQTGGIITWPCPLIKSAVDGHSSNPLRFLAIVRMPVYNRLTQTVEDGRYCIGCEREYRSGRQNWRRQFSKASFDAHLLECGPIQDGRHHGKVENTPQI
jgi:hypothetical protein